jgi:hypothetical protein
VARGRCAVALDKGSHAFVGGYVGFDALGNRSMLGGFVIGLRTSGR